jgi:outer membrane protein assembly factor BamB
VVTGDDTRLVVLTRGRIEVLTRSGEVRSTAALPDLDPLEAWLTDELLFVASWGDDGGTDGELELAALDTATGAVRWRRDDLGTVYLPWPPDTSAWDVVLVEDDGPVALDAETGEERYRLGPVDQRWVHRYAAFAVDQPFESEIEAAASVYAAADGRELVPLPGRRVEAALEVDGLLVTIIAPFGEGPREAVVLDADGALVWQRAIDDAVPQRNCCATILDLDDGHVQLSAGPGAEVLEVEVVSGDVRASGPSDRGRSGQDRYGRICSGGGRGRRRGSGSGRDARSRSRCGSGRRPRAGSRGVGGAWREPGAPFDERGRRRAAALTPVRLPWTRQNGGDVGAGGRWTCEGCGASWGSAARFCGTCGSGATSGQPAVPRGARTAGRTRRAAAAVGALVALGGLAAVALSWPSSAPARTTDPAGPGSDEVALPQPRDLPSPDPGDTEPEVEARPAPDEPTMWFELSCGGDDCERWRRPFDDVPVWGAWRDASEVLFVTGDRLVAWDAETGEDRWERSVASDVALGPQELDGGAWRPPSVTGDDTWLVVIGPGGVQLLTRSGEERWTARSPTVRPRSSPSWPARWCWSSRRRTGRRCPPSRRTRPRNRIRTRPRPRRTHRPPRRTHRPTPRRTGPSSTNRTSASSPSSSPPATSGGDARGSPSSSPRPSASWHGTIGTRSCSCRRTVRSWRWRWRTEPSGTGWRTTAAPARSAPAASWSVTARPSTALRRW